MNMEGTQFSIPLTDPSRVGEVRRAAGRLAELAGLNELERGKVSIVATELSNNLIKYASNGEIVLGSFEGVEGRSIELISIDRGPGIHNVEQSLVDGYSTGSTPGTGLGAVRRLSTEFDIFSTYPGGTVVFSKISTNPSDSVPVEFGVISLPIAGEIECGDGWSTFQEDGHFALLAADGLGHGPAAALAARTAATIFKEHPLEDSTVLFPLMHRTMRGTRGAAVTKAHLDLEKGILRYTGVGNLAGTLISPTERRGLVSHNGTAGVEMRKVQELTYPIETDSVLVVHSDGLRTRWSLDQYPGLIHRSPAVIAAVLYRDFQRGKDDVTVAVAKVKGKVG